MVVMKSGEGFLGCGKDLSGRSTSAGGVRRGVASSDGRRGDVMARVEERSVLEPEVHAQYKIENILGKLIGLKQWQDYGGSCIRLLLEVTPSRLSRFKIDYRRSELISTQRGRWLFLAEICSRR